MATDPNPPDPNDEQPDEAVSEYQQTASELPPGLRPSLDLRGAKDPVWSGWDVLLITFVALIAMFILSMIGFGIALHMKAFRGVSFVQLARDPRLVIPVQAVAYLVVLGCMQLVVRRHYSGPFWRAVHWNFPRQDGYLPFVGGIALALLIQLASSLLPIPKQLPIDKFFNSTTGAYFMVVFGIAIAPLMEELFFRGFLYPVLARWAGVTAGVLITSFLFALIHQSQLGHAWAPLLLLFAVGLVLTGVRAYTGSVARSFLIHVGYNSTLFFLLWLQTDRFHHMEKAASFIFNLKP